MNDHVGAANRLAPNPPAVGRGDDPMCSVEAIMDRLGCSRTFVLEEVRRGRLTAYRLGRIVRFYVADVDAYVEARRIQPGAPIKHRRSAR